MMPLLEYKYIAIIGRTFKSKIIKLERRLASSFTRVMRTPRNIVKHFIYFISFFTSRNSCSIGISSNIVVQIQTQLTIIIG